MTRPRPTLVLCLLLTGLHVPVSLAAVCQGFRPARLDMRGVPPVLARPIVALPGDFDSDGLPDLAVVNRYIDGNLQDGSLSVLHRGASGDYTVFSTVITPGGATWAVAKDLNMDGKSDVATVNNQGVDVYLGNGDATFQPRLHVQLFFNPIHLMSEDMDADGKPDLVVVQQYIGQPQGRVVTLKGNGAGGFTALTSSPVGISPRGGALGDFTQDGITDVVTGSTIAENVMVLPGLGDGNFGPPVTTPMGATALYFAAGHFDGDGYLDLAVTGQTTDKWTNVLRGGGNGSFTGMGQFELGSGAPDPVLCDFDRNGLLDIAIADPGMNSVLLLSNYGAFSFSLTTIVGTDVGPAGAFVYDVNLDGHCDVVTANEDSDSVSILLGGAMGNSLGAPTIATGSAPLGAAAADFDSDGRVDLATVNRDDRTISVFRGNGEGWLFETQTIGVGEKPGAIATGDFNDDGSLDLVVANQGLPTDTGSDTINVLYNDTLGHFSVQHTLTVGDLPLDVKTADFNGDGLDDIVVANSRGDKMSFFLAEPLNTFGNVKSIRIGDAQRTLAIGDFNGDAVPDVAVGLMGLNSVISMLTDPTGWTRSSTTLLAGSAIIDQIATAHLDGNPTDDLVAVSQPTDPQANGLLTSLLGTGVDGTFTIPYPAQSTGVRPEAVAVLQVDGAGPSDLVVANRFDNDVMVFIGDGTGGFAPSRRYGTGNDPFYLAVADFNGDARQDVVSVNFGGNSTSILLNNATPVDPVDDFAFLNSQSMSWGSVSGASSYNLYRGGLDGLDFLNYGQCLAPGLVSTGWTDVAVPQLGSGWMYLLTAVEGASEGPMGYDSECLKRPNFNPCSP